MRATARQRGEVRSRIQQSTRGAANHELAGLRHQVFPQIRCFANWIIPATAGARVRPPSSSRGSCRVRALKKTKSFSGHLNPTSGEACYRLISSGSRNRARHMVRLRPACVMFGSCLECVARDAQHLSPIKPLHRHLTRRRCSRYVLLRSLQVSHLHVLTTSNPEGRFRARQRPFVV